jgi:hypothetical protein
MLSLFSIHGKNNLAASTFIQSIRSTVCFNWMQAYQRAMYIVLGQKCGIAPQISYTAFNTSIVTPGQLSQLMK